MDEAHKKYLALLAERPDFFATRTENVFPILEADPYVSGVFYEDAYVKLVRDNVRFPSGNAGGYLRIISPPSGAIGVAILPIVDHQILLLRHPRHATGMIHLEIPRGFGEEKEEHCESARRELAEEIGWEADKLVDLGLLFPDSGLLTAKVNLFAAEIRGAPASFTPEVGTEIVIHSIDDCIQMIGDGRISDSFTIAAFMRAQLIGVI
jgi:ADP-ribose pyrophosphatase